MKINNAISEKFTNIPKDDDTRIILREEIKLGDYDVIHEKWSWDGVYAESYILFNKDIKGLSEEEVLSLAHKEGATYKELDRYTFVNFNFDVPY